MLHTPLASTVTTDGSEMHADQGSSRIEDPQATDATMSSATDSETRPTVRACELCGDTQTPMWRRGPSGKGTLCNACGVRWSLRRRAPRRILEDRHRTAPKEGAHGEESHTATPVEQYYCKYCGVTWPLNFFKSRQQFGAHCSNCSRKRKSRDLPPNAMPNTDSAANFTHETNPNASPAVPPLTHHIARANAPRKQPRDDSASTRHHSRDITSAHDDLDDFSPPTKKFKSPASTNTTAHHSDSGEEAYYESDSETVTSPYGPSTNSLYRLLGAVENVLTEEREMAISLHQLDAIRAMIDSLDETRRVTLAHLERAMLEHLAFIMRLTAPNNINNYIEQQKAEMAAQESAKTVNGNSEAVTTEHNTPVTSNSHQQIHNTTSNDIQKVDTAKSVDEANKLVKESAPTQIMTSPIPERPVAIPVPVPTQSNNIAVSTPMVQELLASGQIALPPQVENAARELRDVFANATLLQMGSKADIEAFQNCFVQVLNQSKLAIRHDVTTLLEALISIKNRQQQLGQYTFIDHAQLRSLTADLHALKQRVVLSSRAVQSMFVQLVAQFTEQIDAAKRIYQENAGNHVRLLDEVVRARLAPALSREVDLLRQQLLKHIVCIQSNLAYIDTLVFTSE